ncbi:hypothetical protein [Anianabacter salinae]|uniref:hypothetical protein n=1 Tax=Anianabacter salinae TaxID=2851023 RepID=UPI00225DF7DB|nr:hypothetical protein [Anianabacter salinae]MBV0914225.1 hypothetical protein [Anianabacter salinae]
MTGTTLTNVTLRLDADTLAKLERRVRFTTEADVQALVADALNGYLRLGVLAADGGQFFLKVPGRDDMIKMHFPFAAPPGDVAAAAHQEQAG